MGLPASTSIREVAGKLRRLADKPAEFNGAADAWLQAPDLLGHHTRTWVSSRPQGFSRSCISKSRHGSAFDPQLEPDLMAEVQE